MKKFFFWVCLGCISIILMVLGSEGLLRVAGKKPFYGDSARDNFWIYDSTLGWRNQPGQQGIFEHVKAFRTQVRISGKGLRDREYPYARTAGKQRILVLGDSFAWGFGVGQEEMFAKVLERMLGDVEVINAGVSGYGTDQELLWYKAEGVRYNPDLVIIDVCGNDLYENSHDFVNDLYHKPRFVLDSNEQLHLQGVPVPPMSLSKKMSRWLRGHFAVCSYLDSEYRFFIADRYSKKFHPESFRLTFALLSEIRKSADRLMIVATDEFWGTREPYADFIRDLKAGGFQVLDVKSCAGYDDSAMKIPGDCHWNSAGHRFVAGEIFKYIERRGLLTVDTAAVGK